MNGPELRKQSLKLGVPDPRESKSRLAVPLPAVAHLGPEGAGNAERRRRADGTAWPVMLTACSRDRS
jgi:hypothetical protein